MRTATFFVSFLLLGCMRQSEGNGVDTVLKDVTVPGRQTARSVLYGSPSNEDCLAIAERADEVRKASESESPISGLSSRDVQGRLSSYRAYFLPSQLIDVNEAVFVFCQGEKAAFVPVQCSLLGSSSRGCFQTDIYGIADVNGISATVDAIQKHWPDNFEKNEKQGRR